MKNLFIIFISLFMLLGCSNDSDEDISITIESSGLTDGKLSLNNLATFSTNISGYDGDVSMLSYRWILSEEHGQLSDGSNPLANPTIGISVISCFGKIAGDEQIAVEILDASNTIIGNASYDFTITASDDPSISRGCFDQPKIIYRRGLSGYVANYDGSNQQYLGLAGIYGLNIPPNGEWIAHTKYSDVWPERGYVMQLVRCDGTDLRAIPGSSPAEYYSEDTNPDFSPDSETLYFMRPDLSSELAVGNVGRPNELVAYNIETGDLIYLTALYLQNESVTVFTVSPTTGEIAFVRRTFDSTSSERIATLGIMQPETGFTQDLVELPNNTIFGMDWSSDGNDIIFSTNINDNQPGIYRINVTSGSQPLLLFADPSIESLPPGSPHYYADDTRIVWSGQENGTTSINLWTIDANGGDMQQLIDIPQTIFMDGILH